MKNLFLSTLISAGLFLVSDKAFSEAVNPIQNRIFEIESPDAIEKEPFVFSVRQSRLQIEIQNDYKNGVVSMFDILGNKVFEMPANEGVEYSVANLRSGIYFIVLKGSRGNHTRKFLHKQEG